MKLHATPTQQYQTVTAYDDAGVEINAVRFNHSLLLMPETPPQAWPVAAFAALSAEHFAQISAAEPEVVILGTGARQQFAHPRLTAALTARRVGVECMDNRAACRTILVDLGTEGPPESPRRTPHYVARDTEHALRIVRAIDCHDAAAETTYLPSNWLPSQAASQPTGRGA